MIVLTKDRDELLYQAGVKGMKWGQRKARAVNGPIAKGKSLGKVKTKAMSNEQLKQRITRLQMEKQYKELTKPQLSVGKKFVNDVLSNSGKTIATKYVTQYAVQGIDLAIKAATKK